MSYIKCPTCHKLLAHMEIPYEEGLKKICDDNSLTPEQKDMEKQKLLNSFGISSDRYCCRMRLMTYKDIIQIIK